MYQNYVLVLYLIQKHAVFWNEEVRIYPLIHPLKKKFEANPEIWQKVWWTTVSSSILLNCPKNDRLHVVGTQQFFLFATFLVEFFYKQFQQSIS